MSDLAVILDELTQSLHAVDEAQLERAASLVVGAERCFVDGFGRSGLQAKAFGMRLTHLGLSGAIVGDLTTPAITANDLLLICSASGASQALVYHARKAAAIGAKLLVITSVGDSELAKMANEVILIKAPTKQKLAGEVESVQPMGTLFEQTAGAALDALVLKLMRALRLESADMLTRHANLE